MLPDVVIQLGGSAASRTQPTDTGQSFAVLATQRGSTANPMPLGNLNDYATSCGVRQTTSVAYDSADDYFSEGGRVLWASRIVSPTAAQASLNLLDGSAGTSLVVKAGWNGDPDPGTWANGSTGGLSVAVIAVGSLFALQVFLGGVLVEQSPPFATQADAVGWGSGANPAIRSKYLQISLGGSTLVPAVAVAANLAGGTDGTSLTLTDQQTALDRILSYYGPGQVWAPGVTSSAGQLQVIAHAVANNRFALIDPADSSSDATVEASAAALYAAPGNGRRWAQLAAPWEIIPGLTTFSSRTVPPSARLAALYAKIDAKGNPNIGAMGDPNGDASFAQDLSQPSWNATQRLALNNAGVTVSRRRFGGVIRTFGMRTLADQIQDQVWSLAPGVRTVMWYVARAKVLGEQFLGRQVDGQNITLGDWKAALYGPAKNLFDLGALYGATPQEAFSVDTGPAENPASQLAQGQTVGLTRLRVSPNIEQAVVQIVKPPITQALV